MVRVDLNNVYPFVSENEIKQAEPKLRESYDTLMKGTGAGNDFLGWVNLPVDYNKDEFSRIMKASEKIRNDSDALVVIGIGGSYLGARAVIEFVKGPNHNLKKGDTQVFFAGNNLSASYIQDMIGFLENKDWSINVISKSGTTTEPAVAFRIFKNLLEKKYGKEEAAKRIYATTDRARGALKSMADQEGYETFVIPDNVGGRFSVLTPVGLLPIAVAGIDIQALMAGAAECREAVLNFSMDNPAVQYAAARNLLLEKRKCIEILACYEPAFRFMAEWWKQLYGESEGKDGKGLFPASIDLTADLHSMGQYIQEGQRTLFESVVVIDKDECSLVIETEQENLDGLNFLAGKELKYVNEQAQKGTVLAHVDGLVPNIEIHMDDFSEVSLGQLIYFFEYACGLSGYYLGVNPFNQPGVEAYKKNMFALLEKPGYENMTKALRDRLK